MDLLHDLPILPPRPADSHKGTFGRVVLLAGSRGMSGAAILAGSAALRSGAGLVRVAVPASVQSIVASANPCYTTAGLSEDADGRFAEWAFDDWMRLAEENDVVALGPGLGKSDVLAVMAARFLKDCSKPLVLDADGLNAIVNNVALLKERAGPTVLTPHPGEFARLLGKSVAPEERVEAAGTFAREHGVILVLKGHRTLVTDGVQLYENATGNPGMATGGTGDVLTGIVAALLAQMPTPLHAAMLAVHVHGRAGDLARDSFGEVSLIASDLLDTLPTAFKERSV